MILRRSVIAVLLILLAGLQFRLWVGESSFAHVDGLAAQVSQLQASNKAKQNRNNVLKTEIVELKNGLDAVEEKARTEWGLVMPDETFYLLVEKDNR